MFYQITLTPYIYIISLCAELARQTVVAGDMPTAPTVELCFENKVCVRLQLRLEMDYSKTYVSSKRRCVEQKICGTCKLKLGINSNCDECKGSTDPEYCAKLQQQRASAKPGSKLSHNLFVAII